MDLTGEEEDLEGSRREAKRRLGLQSLKTLGGGGRDGDCLDLKTALGSWGRGQPLLLVPGGWKERVRQGLC